MLRGVLRYAAPLLFSSVALASQPAQNLLLTTLATPAPAPFRQTSWPNPVIAKVSQTGFTQQGIRVAPFAQSDWPNPRAAKGANQAFSFSTTPLPATVGDPHRQADWPNPSKASRGLGFEQRGILEVAAVAAPFAQTDWPNPKAQSARSAGDNYSVPATLLEQPAASTDVPRGPLVYTRPAIAPPQQPFPSQLAHLLPPPAVDAPFRLTDWPNPIRAPQRTEGFVRFAFEIPEALFAVNDMSDAQQFARAQPHRGSVTQSRALLDVVPGDPFRQLVWPNPGKKAPSQQPDHRQLAHLLPPPPAQPPFYTLDWPNPVVVKRGRPDHIAGSDPSKIQVALYSVSDTGENPIIAPRRRQPDVLGSSVALLSTPVAAAPFAQRDWANPRARTASQQPMPVAGVLLAQPAPFRQTSWPNPRGYAPANVGFVEFAYPLRFVGAPFRQMDWPLPDPIKRALVQWIGQTPIALFGGPPPSGLTISGRLIVKDGAEFVIAEGSDMDIRDASGEIIIRWVKA